MTPAAASVLARLGPLVSVLLTLAGAHMFFIGFFSPRANPPLDPARQLAPPLVPPVGTARADVYGRGFLPVCAHEPACAPVLRAFRAENGDSSGTGGRRDMWRGSRSGGGGERGGERGGIRSDSDSATSDINTGDVNTDRGAGDSGATGTGTGFANNDSGTGDTPGSAPDTSRSLPDTSRSLPDTSGNPPDTSRILPDTPGSLPDTSGSLPDTSRILPDTSRSLPDTSRNLPDTLRNLRARANAQRFRPVRRLAIVLVDALGTRLCGGPGCPNLPSVARRLRLGTAVALRAVAEPPTVTLPRVKALMTGGVPGFMDFVENLRGCVDRAWFRC
jgi:hypothetical protein